MPGFHRPSHILGIFEDVASLYASPTASVNPLLEVSSASIAENSLLETNNASINSENSDTQMNTLPVLLLLV